jgi:hypothetical protein
LNAYSHVTAFASIIAREFRANATFPIIGEVVVTFPKGEVILVDVDGLTFVMTCGSDDDRFYFPCTNAAAAPVEFHYPEDMNE